MLSLVNYKNLTKLLMNFVIKLMIVCLIVTPVLAFSQEESHSGEIKPAVKEFKNYEDLILIASEKYGVEVNIITAVINHESNFKRYAKGKLCRNRKSNQPESTRNCAQGLMQIVPITAKRYGLEIKDIFDPEKNIDTGVKFLADLTESYKDRDDSYSFVLAAYNAGETRINNFIDKSTRSFASAQDDNSVVTFAMISQHPNFPKETKKYVPVVMKLTQEE